jgi:hypothetical protein
MLRVAKVTTVLELTVLQEELAITEAASKKITSPL